MILCTRHTVARLFAIADGEYLAEEEELRQKARKSPFSNFYQVNIDESPALRKCLDENPKALKLLFFIFDHMDNYNAVICSYQVFQEALGMSGRTVSRAIKYLKDNGFIYIYKCGSITYT